MLLSVAGIIWVQIVWIKNAVSIQNDNFNRDVQISLGNAARAIESSRKMNFLNNYFFSDPLMFNSMADDLSAYFSIGSSYSSGSDDIQVRITGNSFSGSFDSGIIAHNDYILPASDTATGTDTITYVIGDMELAGNQAVRDRSRESVRDQGEIYIAQRDFIEWIRRRSDEFLNMSNQIITEIFQWESTMEIDRNEVGDFLNRSLSLSGIRTPFEFALLKDGKIADGYYRQSGSDDLLESRYKVRLFPDNIIGQDLILSVVFPDRTNYVLGSMAWMLGGSFLFSLFILATFSVSLFFIIRQKKISEMKSDFINNMTHEFKTPIATISLAADTIANPKVISNEPSIKHFIGMIKKENRRMNKKVETILQIASLDKKEIDFSFKDVSLHKIVEHAVETIDIQVQQRQGIVNINLNAVDPVICGDSEHLTNLVNNLLDNAVKYSPGKPFITVETKNVKKGIVLSVEDKGIGMTRTVQAKIFERFYRLSSGDVHDVKGFGLGLNYVRAIVEAHKGAIDVFSEPGKGTRFEVFFPFRCDNQ
jgi:two-component system, OmpR family, phosphate regulon sensor histidine kinase PhoR